MTDPIAYTYEADTHCPTCARARFGQCRHGHAGMRDVPYAQYAGPGDPDTSSTCESVFDGEGNPVGAIAPWDETDPAGTYCGTCGCEIREPDDAGEPIDNPPGFTPDPADLSPSARPFPSECVADCSSAGAVDDAVAYWVRRLAFTVARDEAIPYLRETGAWSADELALEDDATIAGRVMWLACCDIKESGEWLGMTY